ncbi:SMI1/KNR4 family protein [Flavobacterium sp. F-65]|uniref:SMI1/KNR4 family protein n=1 Tax=Flavobacterium pisciphilum TaxID=2893755 RepID=A0ABS8MW59_9FLAO|nr:SMI1/KNR4 family protein [Flavobacterium sp. F-65]MCC9072898.1 SMI1/KNR4 family protein [Flavobacterium sp. F-65]
MWYNNYTFFDKQKGLTDALNRTSLEKNWNTTLPNAFFLPVELHELLQYSNGGGILNGEREFGYFSLVEISTFYLDYEFDKYAPLLMPIALNGGGIFYAYDFRNPTNINLVAVAAGNLEYESTVVIGETLKEMLCKTINIEEELDKLYPEIEHSEEEKQIIELYKQLTQLEANRYNITAKEYLLTKRTLENRIKELKK